MVNTEIRLIIFFTAKNGEALYSQQKQDRPVLQVDFLPLSHGGSICLKRRQLDSDLLLYLIGCTITLMSKLHSYSGENESEKGK